MLCQANSKPVEIHVNLRKETKGKNNDQKLWSIHVCKKNHSARLQLCKIEMGTIQATEMILSVLLGRTNLQTQIAAISSTMASSSQHPWLSVF